MSKSKPIEEAAADARRWLAVSKIIAEFDGIVSHVLLANSSSSCPALQLE